MAGIPESCAHVDARLRFEATVVKVEAVLQCTIALWLTEMLVAIVGGHAIHRGSLC